MDAAIACDGTLFLHNYALYRRSMISEEQLKIYAEEVNMEVQPCKKETVHNFPEAYSVTVGNRKAIHIAKACDKVPFLLLIYLSNIY